MSQTNLEEPARTYFEDILPKTGWGLYYRFMVAMACMQSFMHAMAFLSLPFCITLSTCEHLITEEILLALQVSFALGRSLGGCITNSLCDVYGRKRFLSYSLILIFLSTFTSAFAYNYYVIIFAAFILAIGLELNSCVVRIHLGEILPKNQRGFYLSLCDLFWTLGYISLSLFAILMKTPSVIESRTMDMRLTTWRMTFAICGGLSIILACAAALLEESPRYFLHVKKYYLALLTLKQFYAINKSSYGETFQVKEVDIRNIVNDYGLSIYPEPRGCAYIFEKVLFIMAKAFLLLFSKQFLVTTMLLLIIKIPILILGPLDVNIWLAKQLDVNSTVRDGVDIIYLDSMRNMDMCNSLEENRTLYYIYFILASNSFFGKLFVMLSVDRFGRKLCAVIGLVVSAISILGLQYIKYITSRTILKIIMSSTLIVALSFASTTVSIMTIESFPTALRGTAWGLLNTPGILLSIFVIRYYRYLEEYFPLVMGCLLFGAAVAVYFVSDLKRKPMFE